MDAGLLAAKDDHTDAFFKVCYKGDTIYTSEVIQDNANPEFKEAKFALPEGFEAGETFVIKLLDEDTLSDDKIGKVEISYPISPGSYS